MLGLGEAVSQHSLRQELKTAFKYSFWIVLVGPLAQVLLWAGVEGPAFSWEKLTHLYVLVLVNFLCYTPLFGGGLVLIGSRRIRPNWLAVGLGGAALAVLSSLCATAISTALGVRPGPNWTTALVFSTCRGLVVTSLVLAVAQLYHSAVVNRLYAQNQELDRERAHRAAAEARWNSLESRVHPHFLFNTLSSIRELMHRDLRQADVMIQRFSSLIRFSLDSSRNTLVPLTEEWLTVSEYLEIEKMRLGSRLRYKLALSPECADLTVPALSVLTLVENSVKHAVACRRSGGSVEIAARIEGKHLSIEVCDDGCGFDESAIRPGHGLDLLLSRLESLYESNTASLLLPAANGPIKVTLLIPLTAPNASPAMHHEQTALLPR